MPAKNSIKQFVEGGYYHLYNRGVEKRNIFLDEQDYSVFLHYLKNYLSPTPLKGSDPHPLSKEISMLSFCLMPNHFHIFVKQNSIDGITKFVRAVCTNYVMYFNKKYERVGTLFQGKYKAILIDNDAYFIHLSRYIHLNPYPRSNPKLYSYSSYQYYLGQKQAAWLNTKEILDFFKTARKTHLKDYLSYESFVDDYKIDSTNILGSLTLE